MRTTVDSNDQVESKCYCCGAALGRVSLLQVSVCVVEVVSERRFPASGNNQGAREGGLGRPDNSWEVRGGGGHARCSHRLVWQTASNAAFEAVCHTSLQQALTPQYIRISVLHSWYEASFLLMATRLTCVSCVRRVVRFTRHAREIILWRKCIYCTLR